MFGDFEQIASAKLAELIKSTQEELTALSDTTAQLNELSVIVGNFVNQTLQAVDGDADIQNANAIAVNSLVQIRNFVAERPSVLAAQSDKLNAKLRAYQQSVDVLMSSIEEAQQKADAEAAKKEAIADEVKAGKYDKNGKKRRKIGEKPQKLRDIRKAQAEMSDDNAGQEDI